jgi:hypothetical protein
VHTCANIVIFYQNYIYQEIHTSILDILSQALNANAPEQHFDQVVAHAPANELGSYYAEHFGLIKTLGAAALVITMARMKNNMENKG